MRKYKNITFGGIQQKIFNLVLIMLVLVMATYSGSIVYQMNRLTGIVSDTNEKQKGAITAISQQTMNAVISGSLGSRTQMQAYIANDLFSDTADAVGTLGEYTRMLFENPERYPAREAALPYAALDGTGSVQLLTEAGVDLNDPAIAEKIGLIGNLSDHMLSLYAHAEVDSCYVALPEGVMLLVDDHASNAIGTRARWKRAGCILPISCPTFSRASTASCALCRSMRAARSWPWRARTCSWTTWKSM